MTTTARPAPVAIPRSLAPEQEIRRGRTLALIVIALAQLTVALDATIVNIALPSAQAALGFGDADRTWPITAYTLAFGGLLLLGGRLADSPRLGRQRAFIIGLLGFAAASALSGAAVNLAVLAAARALQGAFAALLAPSALSLLAVTFREPAERAKAFGIYGAIAASGGAIGLLLGGALTQLLDWRWCLFVNVPIALVTALAARRYLATPPPAVAPVSASRGRESGGGAFDVAGLALGSAALVALVSGFGQAATRGWASPVVLALLGASVASAVLFVVRESRAEAPLLPLRIVVDRRRGGAYACALLAIAGMFGAFLFLTYDLQVVRGLPPLQAGLAFLPMSLATFLVATVVSPRVLPRVAPWAMMVPGFAFAASGMAILAHLSVDSAYLTSVAPAELLLGLGVSCVMVPAASAATSGVDQRDAGIASATLNSAQQIGAAVGIAVLNTLAASATAGFLAANPAAAHAEALVHGYAAAATLATVVLVAGGLLALLLAVSDQRSAVSRRAGDAPGDPSRLLAVSDQRSAVSRRAGDAPADPSRLLAVSDQRSAVSRRAGDAPADPSRGPT